MCVGECDVFFVLVSVKRLFLKMFSCSDYRVGKVYVLTVRVPVLVLICMWVLVKYRIKRMFSSRYTYGWNAYRQYEKKSDIHGIKKDE